MSESATCKQSRNPGAWSVTVAWASALDELKSTMLLRGLACVVISLLLVFVVSIIAGLLACTAWVLKPFAAFIVYLEKRNTDSSYG